MGRVLAASADLGGDWTIVSSPLGRAVHTAELVCEAAGLSHPVTTDARLIELDVGPFDGLNREEILALAPDLKIGPGWLFNIPGGESEAALSARIGHFLSEIDETDGKKRLIICHGIAGKMVRSLYAGESLHGDHPPQDAVFHLRGGKAVRLEP
jgi:probable phosphoglycerate mutase